jgi:hypothetical protein
MKQIAKQIFGIPSLEVTERIGDSDKVSSLSAAHYRCTARMRELEGQFDAAFVSECAGILEQEEAAE